MKRLTTVLSLSLLIVLLVAGNIFAQREIEFWTFYTGADGELMSSIVDRFNDSQDEVFVNFRAPGHTQELIVKVQTALISGNPPEILALHREEVPMFKNYVYQLDKFVENLDINPEDYYEDAFNLGIVDGNRYGITMSSGPMGLFYNEDLFREAGLDPEKDVPRTGKELLEIASKLTKIDNKGKLVQATLAFDFAAFSDFFSIFWQNGGELFNDDYTKATFNSIEGVETIKFMQDCIHKYKLMPADFGYNVDQEFMAGRLAMRFRGPWTWGGYFESNEQGVTNFDTAPYIQFGDSKAVYSTSHVYVFPKRNPEDIEGFEASLKFMNWLLTEGAYDWAAAQSIPRFDYIDVLKNHVNPMAHALTPFVEATEYAIFPPAFPEWPEVKSLITEKTHEIIIKNLDAQDALDELAVEVNKILQK